MVTPTPKRLRAATGSRAELPAAYNSETRGVASILTAARSIARTFFTKLSPTPAKTMSLLVSTRII
jgi:hypothetical protein